MQSLQPLHQMLELSSQAFGNADVKMRLIAVGEFLKPGEDFLLPKSVVLELLGRLAHVHMRREHVMQAKLTGKHVHHDANRIPHATSRLAAVAAVVTFLGMFTTLA